MTKAKKLGIWMDHSSAHLMEFTIDPIKTTTLSSDFTHWNKKGSLAKSEHEMHNKEQYLNSEYYKKLGDVIRNYKEVILFGPTDAKVELHNLLAANHLFVKVKIAVRQTDKMTESQQHAFVRDYFSKLA
jgi:hypothetical protein